MSLAISKKVPGTSIENVGPLFLLRCGTRNITIRVVLHDSRGMRSTTRYLIGAGIFAVLRLSWGRRASLGFGFAAIRPGIWLLLVFYALAASVATVWLWMTGTRRLQAAQGGIFTVMLPISATLVGA